MCFRRSSFHQAQFFSSGYAYTYRNSNSAYIYVYDVLACAYLSFIEDGDSSVECDSKDNDLGLAIGLTFLITLLLTALLAVLIGVIVVFIDRKRDGKMMSGQQVPTNSVPQNTYGTQD